MIKIVELFAGVGGFRLAFDKSSERYKTIWANQWEPSRKTQHAFACYTKNFGNEHNCHNEDIAKAKSQVPEHDILVGGFPCQDYSVARTSAQGIEGKKGVLWWEIRDVIESKRPSYVLLENVDRLIKSPAKQRGRDFGIILRCFHDLGYNVEWRVINAAEYGHPQKRRRTFIFASRTDSKANSFYTDGYAQAIHCNGIFAKAFPIKDEDQQELMEKTIDISDAAYPDLSSFSSDFVCPFDNAGVMKDGRVYSKKTFPDFQGHFSILQDFVLTSGIEEKYFLGDKLEKWIYLKGAKKELRHKPNGEEYLYTEGAIPFPDRLSTPSRTMLTSESSVNRGTHVIQDLETGRYRLLTPVECERLNEFPDNWTATGMTESARYFVMGNALVVGVVKKIADEILKLF